MNRERSVERLVLLRLAVRKLCMWSGMAALLAVTAYSSSAQAQPWVSIITTHHIDDNNPLVGDECEDRQVDEINLANEPTFRREFIMPCARYRTKIIIDGTLQKNGNVKVTTVTLLDMDYCETPFGTGCGWHQVEGQRGDDAFTLKPNTEPTVKMTPLSDPNDDDIVNGDLSYDLQLIPPGPLDN